MKYYSWNPCHGCKKISIGCKNCFVCYFDKKREKNFQQIYKVKTKFTYPIQKNRSGDYKIPSNVQVGTCFTSDFFIEEADAWRDDAWQIIKQRPDVDFLICTKRIERFNACIPCDWGSGYDNVIIAVTCENQQKADERLPILLHIKANRKYVFNAPLLESIDMSVYLKSGEIDLVSVGGESYENARICDFDWVKAIKKDCDKYHVRFDFHQTGSNFMMNGRKYGIRHRDEYRQAKKGMQYLDLNKEEEI